MLLVAVHPDVTVRPSVLHEYVYGLVPLLAVVENVKLCPESSVTGVVRGVAARAWFTVTLSAAELNTYGVDTPVSVTTTKYDVVVLGLAVYDDVVAPFMGVLLPPGVPVYHFKYYHGIVSAFSINNPFKSRNR